MYRNITVETTDEQIMAPVVAARKTLVEDATEASTVHFMGERLVRMAQNVATAEAVATAAYGYRDALRNGGGAAASQYLLDLLTRGADDTWSGRENDSKRSAHDGVVAFARKMSDNLRYGV